MSDNKEIKELFNLGTLRSDIAYYREIIREVIESLRDLEPFSNGKDYKNNIWWLEDTYRTLDYWFPKVSEMYHEWFLEWLTDDKGE